MASNVSKTTTDHDTIRTWVEERGGWPAEVASTASEEQTGILRIDFPGWSGEGSLRRIDWDEWFRKFDDANLAFVFEESTAEGQRSNFNKLVGRETAEARARGERTSRRGARAGAGRARGGPRAGGKRQATRREAARTTRAGARAGARSKGRTGRATKRAGAGARGGGRGGGGAKKRGRSSRRTPGR